MDYERIEKPFSQGGGFSPKKLRAMLLGVEKRRKEEEEMESKFSLRSETGSTEIEERRGSILDECKDVSMVSSLSESSIKLKDNALLSSRNRAQEEDSFDSESGSSNFEFHKEHVCNRSPILPPFSKPAPSKWDDAQKWIASPTSNRQGKSSGVQKKMEKFGLGNRQPMAKVVMEIAEEVETKRIDPSQVKKEISRQKPVDWVPDPYPEPDSCIKTAVVENVAADPSISHICQDSTPPQSVTTLGAALSTVRSVSMRDMGTEMTPIVSQDPSRTGTPATATTPIRSPNSSRPSTPQRTAPISDSANAADKFGDCSRRELSEKELQMKTRREIMILGAQLGKPNIAAWASIEEEEKAASLSLKTMPVDQPGKSVIESRAAAWEEAETAKYLARFQREEIKIQAWENHQKAKTEAELRKIEVEVERMRAHSQEKLMNKLAASKHKAEELRALAEAKRNQQAAKTAHQAEYIRRTGHIPPPFSCWNWCS